MSGSKVCACLFPLRVVNLHEDNRTTQVKQTIDIGVQHLVFDRISIELEGFFLFHIRTLVSNQIDDDVTSEVGDVP